MSRNTRVTYEFHRHREIKLVLTAPDDPEAAHHPKTGDVMWAYSVVERGNEYFTLYARGDAEAYDLWSTIRNSLYNVISSSLIDRQATELEKWVNEIHTAYHRRMGTTS